MTQQEYEKKYPNSVPTLNAIKLIISIIKKDKPDFTTHDIPMTMQALRDVMEEDTNEV